VLDLVNGLPLHPLVVHAVVVLLPAAVLGTLAVAVRPAWRERYGVLLLLVTAVATLMVPVATSSGEELEARVGDPGQHAALGDQLLWFSGALLAVVAVLVLAPRFMSVGVTGLRVIGGLAAIAALACAVQVVRVGDSGARAAWGDQVSGPESGQAPAGESQGSGR
jgi:uncharacterized membrane protein